MENRIPIVRVIRARIDKGNNYQSEVIATELEKKSLKGNH
jgi:hypothetical protein